MASLAGAPTPSGLDHFPSQRLRVSASCVTAAFANSGTARREDAPELFRAKDAAAAVEEEDGKQSAAKETAASRLAHSY